MKQQVHCTKDSAWPCYGASTRGPGATGSIRGI
jgi:hypothetical protein